LRESSEPKNSIHTKEHSSCCSQTGVVQWKNDKLKRDVMGVQLPSPVKLAHVERLLIRHMKIERKYMESKDQLIQTSLITGLCLSSLHLSWIVLIILGWAQPLMDFIFKLHMLNSPFQVQPFNLGLAVSLVIITFIIGAFYGLVFFLIKNLLAKYS